MEEETSIELPFTETELKEKYEDKLTKDLSGPVYEVLGEPSVATLHLPERWSNLIEIPQAKSWKFSSIVNSLGLEALLGEWCAFILHLTMTVTS